MHRVRLLPLAALVLAMMIGGLTVDVVGAMAAYLPNRDRLYGFPNQATRIYTRDGQLVASFYRENREYTPIDRIPLVMQRAVMAVEDDRFYHHLGIDPRAMARSLFLTPTRSVTRKAAEIVLALELERRLTKDEILEA